MSRLICLISAFILQGEAKIIVSNSLHFTAFNKTKIFVMNEQSFYIFIYLFIYCIFMVGWRCLNIFIG